MRIFSIAGGNVTESDQLTGLTHTLAGEPAYLWIACARREFEVLQAQIQSTLHELTGTTLVDLHVADLLNNQLPSHYDYTSKYDVLVFRRLAAGQTETDLSRPGLPLSHLSARGGPPILRRIDTSPVGFAVFDHVLLTVHPTGCAVLDAYAAKLLASVSAESRAAGTRLPSGPADLMLRKLPGVFVAGEMLDWEAPTGGYLLQASFSSGVAAAEGVLRWLNLASRSAGVANPA